MRRAVVATITLSGMILGIVAAGLGWWIARGSTEPVVLIQQADGNLLLADGRDRLRPLTHDADGARQSYAFPVPAPDGRSVAYVSTVHGSGVVTSSLIVEELRSDRRTIFQSTSDRPFYLHWSPDSQQIAFLASNGHGMILRTVNTAGEPAARVVTPGEPSYFAWTPDSRRLLLHTGGDPPDGSLAVFALGDSAPRKWKTAPGSFRAPAWLDDGHTAVAVVAADGGPALARVRDDGTVIQRLVTAERGMVFVVAPAGKQLAYVPLEPRRFGNLHIVALDGSRERELGTGPALTALWSPDGTRIAYITFADDGDTQAISTRAQAAPKLAWHVLDVASGRSTRLATFVPSAEFFNLLPFFDQYAQSIRLWDKMSRRLMYADERGVWTLDVKTGEAHRLASGVLGMWIER